MAQEKPNVGRLGSWKLKAEWLGGWILWRVSNIFRF